MGKFIVWQLAKLGNQITIASTMVGLVECKVYAYKVGLDVIKLLERMQIRKEVYEILSELYVHLEVAKKQLLMMQL